MPRKRSMEIEENRDCVISLNGCQGSRGPVPAGCRLRASATPWSFPMSSSTLLRSGPFSSLTCLLSLWIPRLHDFRAPSTSLLAKRSLASVASLQAASFVQPFDCFGVCDDLG